jgi:nucleotide-binding universal stress UspA family protein
MYKRVLVPVDGSEVAEAIVPFILDIAGPLDLEVIVLQVNRPAVPLVMDGVPAMVIDDVEAQAEEAAAYLAGLVAEMRAKGVRASARVRRGEPVAEILAAAREEDADLIAMSTHGRSGPARVVLGSVAERVLRHAGLPVFLMRHTAREVARRREAAAAAR